jgi:hypothetical protein
MSRKKVKIETPTIRINAYSVFENACDAAMRYAIYQPISTEE